MRQNKDKKNKLIVIIGIGILTAIMAVAVFAYRNMNYDILNEKFLQKRGYQLGFTEGIVKLDDDSEIYYLEGPDNGPKLLLLHGQQVSCYDYAKVLPKLSKHFHIYALDYYGHGNSSKNPDKFYAV